MPVNFVYHDIGNSISCIMHGVRENIYVFGEKSILIDGEELPYIKSLECKKLYVVLCPSSFIYRKFIKVMSQIMVVITWDKFLMLMRMDEALFNLKF